ncbi:putative eiotically up-regulated protein [Colletotrichum tanaceti]|nr:putative eiotically up-regulated protein [Colletotrichum tanaceti]
MALLCNLLAFLGLTVAALKPNCPHFTDYAATPHEPFSEGIHKISYQRPAPGCRTASFPEVEKVITEIIIAWAGLANESPDEELSFITTGDIYAEWLRDSSNQLQSYRSLLKRNSSEGSLAALFHGAINLKAPYVRFAPHCNAFLPPEESHVAPTDNKAGVGPDHIFPACSTSLFFECKYELDSLAAFLQLFHDYYTFTTDKDFFARFTAGTYAADGTLNPSPALFERKSVSSSETLSNGGNGAPTEGNAGMVRSFLRLSDNSCIYQLFVPANMMFARYLNSPAEIIDSIDTGLAESLRSSAKAVREGVEAHGKMTHPKFGEIYSYEVDGFGSHNNMGRVLPVLLSTFNGYSSNPTLLLLPLKDDANIPSLLSAPHYGQLSAQDPVYQNTCRFVLSNSDPYQMRDLFSILQATLT